MARVALSITVVTTDSGVGPPGLQPQPHHLGAVPQFLRL